METLQASLALEEIGKEVIKLRNERMASFKERATIANEKKDRAINRKLKYDNDMEMKNKELNKLKEELQNSLLVIETLESTIKSYDEKQNDSEKLVKSEKDNSSKLSDEIIFLKERELELSNKVSKVIEELNDYKIIALNEKESLKKVIRDLEIKSEVLVTSNLMSEKRFEEERKAIPLYQKQLIEEKIRELAEKESYLASKRVDLKTEEERVKVYSEKMRQDLFEELTETRRRNDLTLDDQRKALEEKLKAFQEEKNKFESKISQENYLLHSRSLDVSKKEIDVANKEKDLNRQIKEFEINIKLFEPQIKSLEYEKGLVELSKKDAEDYWCKVRKQSNDLIEAEGAIISKEREIYNLADQIKGKKTELTSLKNELTNKLKSLQEKSICIQREKFSLYENALLSSKEINKFYDMIYQFEERFHMKDISKPQKFILKDILSELNRIKQKFETIVKSLADAVDTSNLSTQEASNVKALFQSVNEIPSIEIKGKEFNSIILPHSSSNIQYKLEDLSVSLFNSHPTDLLASDLNQSIASATQSLAKLKEFGAKYNFAV